MQKKSIVLFIILFVFIIGSFIMFYNFKDGEVITVVPDFNKKTYDSAVKWCRTNLVDCDIRKEYSDIKYDKLISQSVQQGKKLKKYGKIVIIYSNGQEATDTQSQIMEIAKKYSDKLYLSKTALYNELIALKYSEEDAEYAVNHIDVDYKENALKRAKEYKKIDVDEASIRDDLLSSQEGFTKEEVDYAMKNLE